MDNKPNFPDFVIRLMFLISHGFCMSEGCVNKGVDLHHRLSNTKLNNKKFPLFLQSIFNCILLCRKCHTNYSLLKNVNITDQQAECYEKWLQNFKEVNK